MLFTSFPFMVLLAITLMVYYAMGSRVDTFDFVLYGAMIVSTLLNRGTPGDFIYFQF